MIYLATPYNHPDLAIMEARFIMACKIAGALMRRGYHIFSPIAHTHPIAVHSSLPKGWDFWERYDRQMIGMCEAIWVVKLEGWQESKGVNAEIQIAQKLGKPVKYIEPKDFEVR